MPFMDNMKTTQEERIIELEEYIKERCEYQCVECPVHNCKDRKEGVKMVKFEFQFVGYLECENKTEAQKILYAYERALGYLTRNDLNLYATELKEMPNEEVVTDD